MAAAGGGRADPGAANTSQPEGDYYRFPYGVPIVLYPLLAIAQSAVQRHVWGAAVVVLVLLAIAIAFTRLAFGSADFDQARANDPSLNLATWRINWLLFFALPPALLAPLGAVGLLRG